MREYPVNNDVQVSGVAIMTYIAVTVAKLGNPAQKGLFSFLFIVIIMMFK